MSSVVPTPMPRSWLSALRALGEYSYLVRPQITQLSFSTHTSSRYTRKVLRDMIHDKLVGRTKRKITYDELRSGCPVYYLTQKGVEALAGATHNDNYLACTSQSPRADRLEHWVGSSDIHMRLDAAIATQTFVSAPIWVNEWNKFRADGRSQFFCIRNFKRSLPNFRVAPMPPSC